MRFRRSFAIFRNELRILAGDPAPMIVFIAMPLVLMAFMEPVVDGALAASSEGASGADHVVPGMAVMSAFFFAGATALAFFREHGWGTWDRLRSSPASGLEILTGKFVLGFASVLVQILVLFTLGGLIYGLEVRGSVTALALVSALVAITVVTVGVALVSACRTIQQVNAVVNLGALGFAGFGGAFTPVTMLPGWMEDAAPATPTYWAMEAYRSIIVDGEGWSAIAGPAAMLVAFAALFTVIALSRLRFEDAKTSWS
uniref:Transport permease protein n=1 Tax=uncultured bacterium AB_162 TaxID=1630011 RepID=A0A0E3M0I6_9BACT|nr:ABC-2 type transporter [uncultured bacterium AB_162]